MKRFFVQCDGNEEWLDITPHILYDTGESVEVGDKRSLFPYDTQTMLAGPAQIAFGTYYDSSAESYSSGNGVWLDFGATGNK